MAGNCHGIVFGHLKRCSGDITGGICMTQAFVRNFVYLLLVPETQSIVIYS